MPVYFYEDLPTNGNSFDISIFCIKKNMDRDISHDMKIDIKIKIHDSGFLYSNLKCDKMGLLGKVGKRWQVNKI